MIFATVLPFLQILRISNDFTSYSLERSEWKSGSITFIRCSATGYGQFWPRLSLSLSRFLERSRVHGIWRHVPEMELSHCMYLTFPRSSFEKAINAQMLVYISKISRNRNFIWNENERLRIIPFPFIFKAFLLKQELEE